MSKSPSKRTPVRRPSASAPNVAAMDAGWRFVVARIDSGREYTPRTGRPVTSAAIASSGWIDRSSLPPKPPPQADGTTRTRSGAMPRMRASSSRSMYGVWVVAQTSTRPSTTRAVPASGSMYACSTNDGLERARRRDRGPRRAPRRRRRARRTRARARSRGVVVEERRAGRARGRDAKQRLERASQAIGTSSSAMAATTRASPTSATDGLARIAHEPVREHGLVLAGLVDAVPVRARDVGGGQHPHQARVGGDERVEIAEGEPGRGVRRAHDPQA